MKLHELEIQRYKNLSGKYSFKDNSGYIALIGLNGSGKSNLLETISLLFFKIMGILDNVPFADYSLIYEIRDHGVNIIKGDSLDNGSITMEDLPSSVIACYSGEDDRLWESGFKDYYTKFFNAAISGGEYKPRALYVNKRCWEIAFISLLFSENEEIRHFIGDTLKINVESIRIQFKTKKTTKVQKHDASNWYQRVDKKFNNSAIKIENLKTDEDVPLGCNMYPELTNDQVIFYYLYFLYMPDKQSSPGLNADNVIDSIDIMVNGFDFEDFSEGEKKLILIECVTKVLGDENSLILLDEPDAHTHIAMKKDLLKLISEFEGQTIMTTHSPMFLNKRWDGFNENNIFYMHDGKIESTELLKCLSELTDNEIDYFEGSFILSSKNILVTEGPYDVLYIKYAINQLAEDNPNYLKIKEQVAFMHAGGANNAEKLYELTLYPVKSHLSNLAFLFDYDKDGYTGANQLIKIMVSKNDTTTSVLYYQPDYISDYNNEPNDNSSYMVEDLFAPESYKSKVDIVHHMNTYKDFRNNKQATAKAIKKHIEENYSSFNKEWLSNFRPVLDKLLEVFNL